MIMVIIYKPLGGLGLKQGATYEKTVKCYEVTEIRLLFLGMVC